MLRLLLEAKGRILVAKPDEQDKLVLRMGQCETVINDLENSPVWKIVISDMENERQELDDNWQGIWDEDKLLAARVLKFSCKHILDLKYKYTEELKYLKILLKKMQSPETEVMKDYDVE